MWLQVAGGFLVVAGVGHLVAHVSSFVLEGAMVGRWEFAMQAMRQARSTDPLAPSLWRIFRSFSTSFGMLLVFAGLVDVVVARVAESQRTLAAVALLGTVFWTVAFLPYAFVDPVIQPIVVAAVSVPLHGLAALTAAPRPTTSEEE